MNDHRITRTIARRQKEARNKAVSLNDLVLQELETLKRSLSRHSLTIPGRKTVTSSDELELHSVTLGEGEITHRAVDDSVFAVNENDNHDHLDEEFAEANADA